MSRLFSFSLLLALLAGSSVGRAETVDYFLPVTYDMVITRSVAESGRTVVKYELFATKDLLRSILAANGITSLSGWSLVAKGSAAPLADTLGSRATDTLSSLRIVARNSKTKQIKEPTAAITISLTPTSDLSAFRRVERQTAPTEGAAAVVSATTVVTRLAELTQKLPVRGARPAGALEASGQITYTNVYNKISDDNKTTTGPVLRPVGGTFRAAGQFNEDGGTGSDGLTEVNIVLGPPDYVINETSNG